MAKPLSELINKTSATVRAKSSVRAAEILAEMNLTNIRKLQKITQDQIAEVLCIKQPSVAQLEKRTDIYISTLRSYLSSFGGKLELVASFPDGTKISISGFDRLGKVASKN